MIQSKTPILAAGLLAVALCAPAAAQDTGAAPAAEAYEFKVSLNKGDRFAFRQVMDLNQDLNVQGMEISTAMSMTSDYEYDVRDVLEDGNMVVKIKFGRIKGSFENPMMGGAIEFDSDNPDAGSDNPMAAMVIGPLTANAGQELTLTLTPAGEVAAIDGIDEMIDRMLEANPMAAMQGLDAASLKEQMKGQFEGQLGQVPGEPVAVGDTWTNDRAMSGGMQGMGMQMSVTSKLVGLSGDEAEIASDIKGELTGGGQMAQMMQVEDFSGTSTTKLSRKDGLVNSSSATINMTATMDAGPQGQGGMTMAITTKLERIPVTPKTEAPAETPAETPSGE